MIVRPSAAPLVPADLPPRAGVVVMLTEDEHHNAAWSALTDLSMVSQVWFWPLCRDWLTNHVNVPARTVERRTA